MTVAASAVSDQTEMQLCAGCGDKIFDRYYLSAVDKFWHQDCLRCCACQQMLESERSCFYKDGQIFCKSDYYSKYFSSYTCARCRTIIDPSDLVMKARDLVFHLSCFCCSHCGVVLQPGQEFGTTFGTVYCRLHFEMAHQQMQLSMSMTAVGPFRSPNIAEDSAAEEMLTVPQRHCMVADLNVSPTQSTPMGNFSVESESTTAVSKGRPRKRKSSRRDLDDTLHLPPPLEMAGYGYMQPSAGGMDALDTVGHFSQHQTRQKRIRTSFKHHQLRTMKAYFAINHNPDAKDLKQLAQKTGLSKRVLQVWFQNARAKFRRQLLKEQCPAMGGGLPTLDSAAAQSPCAGQPHSDSSVVDDDNLNDDDDNDNDDDLDELQSDAAVDNGDAVDTSFCLDTRESSSDLCSGDDGNELNNMCGNMGPISIYGSNYGD